MRAAGRRRGWLRAAGTLGALLLLSGPSSVEHQPLGPVEASGVWHRGCAVVLAGDACVLSPERVLTLWVRGAAERDVRAEVDGERTPAQRRNGEDGVELVLTVPRAAREVVVRGSGLRVALHLAELPHGAELEALRAQRRRGELDRLERGARALLKRGTPVEAALARGLLARAHLDRGQQEAAIDELRASMAAAVKAGAPSAAVRDAVALAYTLRVKLRRFDAASAVLAALEPLLVHCPELRSEVSFERAACERDAGDLRAAMVHLRAAEASAKKLGDHYMLLEAGLLRARLLEALGRDEESLALFDTLGAFVHGDACAELLYVQNRGWAELLLAERGTVPTPQKLLARARELSAPGGSCARASWHVNARVNGVLADVHDGRLEAAERELSALRDSERDALPEMEAWLLEVRGRLSLQRGQGERALAAYDELRARASMTAAESLAWQAELGRGRALELSGKLAEATLAYRAAERALDAEGRKIPVGEGRDTFAGLREQSAIALVDVLERQEKSHEALEAARLMRSRALRSLARVDSVSRLDPEERARWTKAVAQYQRLRDELSAHAKKAWQVPRSELAAFERAEARRRDEVQVALDRALSVLGEPFEQLTALAEGEVLLMFFPLRSGWVGFVSDGQTTRSHRFASAPGDASLWLAPFAPELLSARTVRVLPYGAVRDLDFHALDLAGKPLIEQVPVVYGLDIGAARGVAVAKHGALVVSDPRGDLPKARSEGAMSARALASWHAVEVLSGPSATRAALLALLSSQRILHFAGHGKLAGRESLESALMLTPGEALEVSDILTLRSVPEHVVLSGCETARQASRAPVATLGLAQAFVASGARTVIATTREVHDDAALAFTRALYADAREPTFDAAHFQRALLAFRQAHGSEWRSFRLLVP